MHTAALLAGCGLVHSEISGQLIGALNSSGGHPYLRHPALLSSFSRSECRAASGSWTVSGSEGFRRFFPDGVAASSGEGCDSATGRTLERSPALRFYLDLTERNRVIYYQ